MARQTMLYVKWGHGGLEARVSNGALVLKSRNYELVFEPRSVVVDGKYSGKKEIEHLNRRTVFVEFAEKLEPIEPPRLDIVGRNYIGNFELVYTDLDFEQYLTIITPADYLYDYAVLTTEELMLYMQAKRKVFYEEEPFVKLIIYIK